MDTAPPALPQHKISKSYGLKPAYALAVKVIAKRRRHEIESEVIRAEIDSLMRSEEGKDWESRIVTIALAEGVLLGAPR